MTDLDHHGLTTADLNHRIWMIIGIHWPHRISNKMIYHRCPSDERWRPVSNIASVWTCVTNAARFTSTTCERQLSRRHSMQRSSARDTLGWGQLADLRRMLRSFGLHSTVNNDDSWRRTSSYDNTMQWKYADLNYCL